MIRRVSEAWGVLRSLWLWIGASASDKEHVFITGAPRSGTTLLKTILTAHPALAGGDGESTGIFKLRNLYEYSCGETDNGWISVSVSNARDVVNFYDQLACRLVKYYGGTHFVDKIWPRRYRLRYVVSKFPRGRWIHIVRDGRDSYCSARKHPNVPQSSSLKRFAAYWARCNTLVQQEVPQKHKVVVKYESLTGNPEQEISRIMDFLSLSVDARQLNPAKHGHVPSIHKRNYHQRLAQPLDTKSVDRFKTEMSPSQQQVFANLTSEVMSEFGYL